ncbi:hypothetical protein PA25_37580 [Pseudoalteromonas sp. A25]|uniref:hypothetical protein n=1 Tax=Pseudoalteromonas sp. A25 TaxID=116092 RepID=UPI00129F0D68|nr:hypothetical protein [Pseudoalteromonas sp. A25]BBN83773.1 hypothetical protein PA25_37580 [Pseudoalteromonas sp. A25]
MKVELRVKSKRLKELSQLDVMNVYGGLQITDNARGRGRGKPTVKVTSHNSLRC